MGKTVYRETIMLRQTVTLATAILSVTPRLSLSVCPAVKAYISVTMNWILMKLGEIVGT